MASNDKSDHQDGNLNPCNNLHSSAMTPSIIHTINNTSPTPPINALNGNNNNNSNSLGKPKRTVEQYESYIEDSFVGHWEREDDDPDNPYHGENNGENPNNHHDSEEDTSALHPSTIEFDFDSFGPESFIYTPAPTAIAPSKNLNNIDEEVNVNRIQADQDLSANTSNSVRELDNKIEKEVGEARNNSSNFNHSTATDNNDNKLKLDVNDLPINNMVNNEIDDSQLKHSAMNTSTISPLDQHLIDETLIDMRVIEPYKKVISHAGYSHHIDPSIPEPKPGEPAPAIIVFSACYLPDRSRRDYNYVMDHLFLYVLSSLHELIADDYILVYLHNTQPSSTIGNFSTISSISNILGGGGTSTSSLAHHQHATTASAEDLHQNNLPTFNWIKRCYQMIDRKLRKNLKTLYLVKPTFWLKTIVIMCKPFISAKFSKKLRFIDGMDSLRKCLPVDKLILPASAENI